MSITTYSTNKLPKLILFQERAKERISGLNFLKNRTTSSQFGTNFSGNEIYQERKILHILLNNNKKPLLRNSIKNNYVNRKKKEARPKRNDPSRFQIRSKETSLSLSNTNSVRCTIPPSSNERSKRHRKIA